MEHRVFLAGMREAEAAHLVPSERVLRGAQAAFTRAEDRIGEISQTDSAACLHRTEHADLLIKCSRSCGTLSTWETASFV